MSKQDLLSRIAKLEEENKMIRGKLARIKQMLSSFFSQA